MGQLDPCPDASAWNKTDYGHLLKVRFGAAKTRLPLTMTIPEERLTAYNLV
jgi:hypothetical protein